MQPVDANLSAHAMLGPWSLELGTPDGRPPVWLLKENGDTRGAFPGLTTGPFDLARKLSRLLGPEAAKRLVDSAFNQCNPGGAALSE